MAMLVPVALLTITLAYNDSTDITDVFTVVIIAPVQ
jgi:hypothetical protein